jgi:hypothetical protein
MLAYGICCRHCQQPNRRFIVGESKPTSAKCWQEIITLALAQLPTPTMPDAELRQATLQAERALQQIAAAPQEALALTEASVMAAIEAIRAVNQRPLTAIEAIRPGGWAMAEVGAPAPNGFRYVVLDAAGYERWRRQMARLSEANVALAVELAKLQAPKPENLLNTAFPAEHDDWTRRVLENADQPRNWP